jgi:hypothetical protein
MSSISFNPAYSTVVLNGHAFTSLAVGDNFTLAPVNELTSQVNSTNGGVTVTKRSDGGVHDLTLRVQRYSDDDQFLNSAINAETPTILNGSVKGPFVKDGTDMIESWILEQGSITTRPTEAYNDQDGNGVMEYKVRFRNAVRNI